MLVFDFTGGREITPSPAKSGNSKRNSLNFDRGSRLRGSSHLSISRGATAHRPGVRPRRPARSKSNQHAAQPERSQSQENAGCARAEARGTTPACGTYDDMRYVSCGFVRVSSKCHLVQSDVIMALLSFVLLTCGIVLNIWKLQGEVS